MTTNIMLAFALFAFVSSITPGPNNLMLLASGINYGFRASIPHMLGVGIGFFVMVFAIGSGLGIVFEHYPILNLLLKWAGAFYLLYLAWKIAHSSAPEEKDAINSASKPISFLGAAAFQWVNPKAWIMGISAFSSYVPHSHSLLMVLLFSCLFGVINLPCISLWTVFGIKIRHYLQNESYLIVFNWFMALLLVLSLVPILL